MAFNGSGTFNRLYRWVNDAANGLFISAPKFDAEMDGMATGLSNAITRDGQSPPTADIPMGGHKLTGLANGTSPGDAATLGQLNSALNEWVVETGVVTLLGPTSFKVAGSDLRQRYPPGQRILWTSVGPGWTLATVVSSSFSAAETTVTVICDTGTLTAFLSLAYGLINYGLPSYLSPRSAVYATPSITSSASAGTANTVPYDAAHAGCIDALGEFTGTPTYRFTAKYPGRHRFVGNVAIQATGNVTGPGGGITMQVNGVNTATVCYTNFPGTYGPGVWMNMPFHFLVDLNAGGYVSVLASMSGASWATGTQGTNLLVERIV